MMWKTSKLSFIYINLEKFNWSNASIYLMLLLSDKIFYHLNALHFLKISKICTKNKSPKWNISYFLHIILWSQKMSTFHISNTDFILYFHLLKTKISALFLKSQIIKLQSFHRSVIAFWLFDYLHVYQSYISVKLHHKRIAKKGNLKR